MRAFDGTGQRSIVIFGIHYAPELTGAGLNTTLLAEGLAQRGWRVEVVTGIPHYPDWRRSPAPKLERRGGILIRRRPHLVPTRQNAITRASYEASWLISAAPQLALRRSVDIALGISPAVAGAALAAAAALRYGVPYALLFQDLAGRAATQSGISGGENVARFVTAMETGLARGASGVAVVGEGFFEYFRRAGVPQSRMHLHRNPARLDPVTTERTVMRLRLGWKVDEFVVLHTGSMGLKQGLTLVLEAAASCSDPNVRFVLQGNGNQARHLREVAATRKLKNVTFAELAPTADYANILGAADALLLCQLPTVENMSMPAKLGSYMAAKRPVIASVASADGTAREIHAAASGLVIAPGSPQALLEAVRQLRDHPLEAAAMGRRGGEFAAKVLNREAALDAIDSFLCQSMRRGSHPT